MKKSSLFFLIRIYFIEVLIFAVFFTLSMVGISYYFKHYPVSSSQLDKKNVESPPLSAEKNPEKKETTEEEYEFYTLLTKQT